MSIDSKTHPCPVPPRCHPSHIASKVVREGKLAKKRDVMAEHNRGRRGRGLPKVLNIFHYI